MTSIASRLTRATDALRTVRITRSFTMHAEGSVLIEFGNTKVLCTASSMQMYCADGRVGLSILSGDGLDGISVDT